MAVLDAIPVFSISGAWSFWDRNGSRHDVLHHFTAARDRRHESPFLVLRASLHRPFFPCAIAIRLANVSIQASVKQLAFLGCLRVMAWRTPALLLQRFVFGLDQPALPCRMVKIRSNISIASRSSHGHRDDRRFPPWGYKSKSNSRVKEAALFTHKRD
jgi:hypothetical protein